MTNFQLKLLLLFLFISINIYAQVEVIEGKEYKYDTLNINSFSLNFDLLFHISDDEMNEYTDYEFSHSTRFNYLFKRIDMDLIFRQILERQDDGSFYYNHFLFLSSGIYKYKPVSKGRTVLRSLYPEPLFIYQNNSDRGLQRRFQLGALLHPWALVRKRIKLNFGVGFVYDWSSWSVNDSNKINDAPAELQEKIRFINERITLRKNKYQDYSEFRPMLLINMHYDVNDILNIYWGFSYQQSLSSPYSKEIREAYPDLKKVYPYILSQLDINVKVYKGITLRLSARVDYENNNLSLYDSSWEYDILLGAGWRFSTQKVRK